MPIGYAVKADYAAAVVGPAGRRRPFTTDPSDRLAASRLLAAARPARGTHGLPFVKKSTAAPIVQARSVAVKRIAEPPLCRLVRIFLDRPSGVA
jgi:hypothetical protein